MGRYAVFLATIGLVGASLCFFTSVLGYAITEPDYTFVLDLIDKMKDRHVYNFFATIALSFYYARHKAPGSAYWFTDQTFNDYLKALDHPEIPEYVSCVMYWVFVGTMVSSAYYSLVNGCLLYGLLEKKVTFMNPWIVTTFVELTVTILLISGGSVVLSTLLPGGFLTGLYFLAITIPFLAVSLHVWTVIFRAYMEIRNEKMTQKNLGQTISYVKL